MVAQSSETTRGGAAAAREAHNLEVAGAIPAPAPIFLDDRRDRERLLTALDAVGSTMPIDQYRDLQDRYDIALHENVSLRDEVRVLRLQLESSEDRLRRIADECELLATDQATRLLDLRRAALRAAHQSATVLHARPSIPSRHARRA